MADSKWVLPLQSLEDKSPPIDEQSYEFQVPPSDRCMDWHVVEGTRCVDIRPIHDQDSSGLRKTLLADHVKRRMAFSVFRVHIRPRG
jgi:hypothetical protein